MSLEKRVRSGSVSQRYGSALKCHGSSTLVFILSNLFCFLRRIAYINKLDKPAADVSMTVTSMMRRLETVPLVLQTPLGQAAMLCIPNRKNVFRIPPFSDPDPTLQIHSESASYLQIWTDRISSKSFRIRIPQFYLVFLPAEKCIPNPTFLIFPDPGPTFKSSPNPHRIPKKKSFRIPFCLRHSSLFWILPSEQCCCVSGIIFFRLRIRL
jgi:hypothetical protein